MFNRFNTKFLPFVLGLALAGCATLASTGDGCALPDLSEDELWQLEPESASGAGSTDNFSAQATIPKIAKSQLIELVASKTNLNKLEAGQAIDALLESMGGELAKGNSIGLPGFGTLRVSYTKARAGRNPKTGATIQIAASSHLALKTASTLKDQLPKTNPYADPAVPPPAPVPAPTAP